MDELLHDDRAHTGVATAVESMAGVRRLVVVLPIQDINESAAARALFHLAAPTRVPVLILVRAGEGTGEPEARLRTALLAALLRESGLDTDIEHAPDYDWRDIVLALYAPGDLVVCAAERSRCAGGLLRARSAPLSSVLAAEHIPVCELPAALRTHGARPQRRVVVWLAALIVLAGSFAVQAAFIGLAQNWATWARQVALIALSGAEIASLVWLADAGRR